MPRPGSYPERLPDSVLARCQQLPVKPDKVTLIGDLAELRPFEAGDADGLHAVSNGQPFTLGGKSVGPYDAEALVWRWMKAPGFADAAALRDDLVAYAAIDDVRMLTVRHLGIPVGVACLMTNRPADLKLELGSIWYGPIAQGTGVAREATRLMLA